MMNKDVSIGMNIGGISYYSSEVKWVDVAKQSQEWITEREGGHEWDTHEHDSVSWRPDGYPERLEPGLKLLKLMLRDFGAHEESGNYTILYEGEGDIEFSLTEHHTMYEGKGRMVINFPNIGSGGILMVMTATNPDNPIRNIRVLPPGYENTYERFPFHPLFLEFLKRYSEIRFMDYLNTNNHKPEPTTWDSRMTPDFHTHEGGGSIEYLVQLANTLGADPWVCMPHAADDNYVRQFATYVKNKLRPDLNVWGSDKNRITNVYAWQTGFQDYYRQALEDLGDRKSSFQALGITGYFDCDQAAGKNHATELPSMSMTQIQQLCDNDLPDVKASFSHYMDVAKAHGLKLVMYEGGPSVMENGAIVNGAHVQEVTDKAIAFNKDPAIEKPVQDVLKAWEDIVASDASNSPPGGLFNYFSSTGTPSKYGSWGMAEYTGQDLSQVPKWLAVQTFISRHWPNNPLGPKCSFVKDPATDTAYGCFKSGQHYVCAKSADDGQSWTNLPSLHQDNADHLTLDGFDPDAKKLYVRVTDTTDVNTYHVYSETSHHWTTMMNKDVTVGINLGGITYYSSEVKWVDVAKQSQEWITQRQGVSQWSTADLHVVKLMLRDFGMHEEKGNYTILYDGDGFLDFGRMVVDFPNIGHSGILLKVLATNPHNPIHNIRVLPPGYENTYERFPFHPLFLEFLKRFSEIRFMDYLHTNGHGPEPTTWSTRRLPDFHTQAGEEGGAIEYLVQLANTLGVDPWICVPHAADDNYIRQLATYVKNKLRPDRKVYVEYSNEVWNNLFRQAKYTQEQGHPLYPGHAAFKQGMMYHNQRATEIADMWTQVWGSAKDRVVNVFAWQTGFRDYYRQALDDLGDRKSSFQAMAITGYFGCDQAAGEKHAAELPGMTMEEIQHLCDIDLPNKREQFTHYMDVAKAHGLKLVMYEGGPGIMEGGAIRNGAHVQAVTDKAIAFHQDSHIQRPVQDVLEAWYDIVTSNGSNASPGGLFNYFSSTGTPSKYGSWGMAQYTGQDLSQVPKWLGVQTFISQHWPNNPLGPKCSFVKDPTTDTAYGCFKSGQHYVCAKSADDGRSWANLPTLHQHNTDHVTLDGFDPTHKKLYVRVTDTTDVNTYHVYSEDSNHWTT
nr:hypothetical protein BaRGS_010728 [Batillaria attramentaria]